MKNLSKKTKKIILISVLILIVVGLAIILFACGKQKKDNLAKISSEFSNYYIDLEYKNDSKTAVANCEIDYCNNTDAMLKEIKLHLYIASFCKGATNLPVSDLNFKKAFYNGESYATLNIVRVQLNGEDVNPSYENTDNDIMVIELKSSLFPTERVNISIEYNFSLPNCNHRFGYGENTINLGNFYPVVCGYDGEWKTESYCSTGDPFFSEMANYFVNFNCDENLTVASTGEIKNSTTDGGTKFYNIEALCVRDFAFVLSEKFSVLSAEVNGVNVNYFYTNDKNAQKALDCSVDAIRTFSDLFYAYPYSTYNVVQADFCYGGMEYPNLSLISNAVTNSDDYLNVIVHETAHQWWYNLVGNDEYNNSWLDEALTEYSTILFYDYNEGYNFNHADMINAAHENFVFYRNVYEDVLGSLDTSMTRPVDEFDTEPEYTYTIYVKGVLMYDSLYNLVGKDKFIKSLKQYTSSNAYKIAKTENLIGAFEDVCKTDLANFFDCWLSGKVIVN